MIKITDPIIELEIGQEMAMEIGFDNRQSYRRDNFLTAAKW